MFAAEARALTEISARNCIRVPNPVAYGSSGNTDWLLLEYLELTSSGSAAGLGEQLAAMHESSSGQFGWAMDNFIGTNPQYNGFCDSWSEFWRDRRLKPQLRMAESRGFGGQFLNKATRLLADMELLMDGHQPAASLLHGDLWAGNKAYTVQGQAVIYDPASYFGDRETDLAMTELFGGFEASFYAAYQAHSPLPDGYRLRRDVYNLYHMLNHLNLFGRGYLPRCEHMINSLLAQIH